MAFGMDVADQKREATELLSKLRMVDPFAMIAGGAPRDWYFNKSAKDLDVYMRLPNHNTVALVSDLARLVGITHLSKIDKVKESTYAELPNLKWVFIGEYNGLPINLMVMEKGVREEIIKDFDVAICRAWFDGEQCHYMEEFEFCVKTRVCLVHEKYTGKEAHVRKMAKRFPQFMFFKKVEIPEGDVPFAVPHEDAYNEAELLPNMSTGTRILRTTPHGRIVGVDGEPKKTLDNAWDHL